MEKIFFLISVVLILGFVLYLGGTAIMKGFSAKNANKLNEKKDDQEPIQNFSNEDKLSDELDKLNQLLKDGVLTQEEFEKAKKKNLED